MGMKMTGASDVIKKLRTLPQEVAKRHLLNAVKAAAVPIADRMEALAPKGDPSEPNVSNIVTMTVRSTEPMTAAVWVGPEKAAYYAYFLEYGTRKMAARPFARPAFDSENDEAQAILKTEVWDAFLAALR